MTTATLGESVAIATKRTEEHEAGEHSMNMNIRLRILTRGLGELAMSIHWRADLTLDDTSCCNWQAAALDYYADKASARRQLCASARVGLREFLSPQILPTPANGGLHEKTSADALQTLPAAVLLREVCHCHFRTGPGHVRSRSLEQASARRLAQSKRHLALFNSQSFPL